VLLQLEPRALCLGRGAYWDWCRLSEQQQAREHGGWWCCVTSCVTYFLAMRLDKTASVVVGCVHEVNQQQGGSNEYQSN